MTLFQFNDWPEFTGHFSFKACHVPIDSWNPTRLYPEQWIHSDINSYSFQQVHALLKAGVLL